MQKFNSPDRVATKGVELASQFFRSAVIGLSLLHSLHVCSASSDVRFDRIEMDTLFFKSSNENQNLKPIKTQLLDLAYLGAPQGTPEGMPLFLFTAKACQNCIEDKSIYVFHPKNEKSTSFVYPGKVLDPKTRTVLLESRAFFGHCLASRKGDIYIVYQKEKVDRRSRLQTSVFIAEPGDDFLHENLIERNLPNINTTLRLKKNKVCHEIEGRNRFMSAKSFGLRNINEEDDENENSNEKEKVKEKATSLE